MESDRTRRHRADAGLLPKHRCVTGKFTDNTGGNLRIESKYTPEVVRAIPKRAWLRFLMASPQWLLTSRKPRLASRLFEVYMNERVVDYPFVLSNLQVPTGARILDLGCLS